MTEKKNPLEPAATSQSAPAQENFDAPQTPASSPPQQTPSQQAAESVPQSSFSKGLSQQAESAVQNNRMSHADTGTFRGYLDEWLSGAKTQSGEKIERGVTQGVNELARVQEDAQEQFQTQRNQIDLDERRALDNRAAYDAARGVRGGIASEQYNSIQNAAMQNRVTVNTAQTKLANDTRRQIAELRANGEFQKAQELLQLNQEYISQLSTLERWAMDYNANVDQFNASMEQWLASYNFQLRQMNLANYQWEQSFAYQKATDERNYKRSVYESDRAFDYQQGRDAVLDARDQRNFERSVLESDRAFDYQKGRDAALDARDQRNYNRSVYESDRAFEYQQGRDAALDARDQRDYNRSVLESDRAFDFQRQQYADSRSDTKWQQDLTERQYADSRADTRWQQGMAERQYTDSRSDAQWQQGMAERQYADSRSDAKWQQGLTERQYADSRSDAQWQQGMTERQYADSRADAQWQQGMTERQFAASQSSGLQQYVMTALSNGYMVDDDTLKEAGIDKNYASLIVSNARNAAAFDMGKAAAELENKQADTLSKQASASKTLSELGKAQKPPLTLEELQDEISEKNFSPNVLSAYEYYYGESYFLKNPQEYPIDSIKSRKDAVSALEVMGLSKAASGLMNSSQWNSRKVKWMKDKAIDDPAVSGYDSFMDYVRDYVRAMRGDNLRGDEAA